MGKKKYIKELRKFKQRLSNEIPVEKIIFFGSRAKGKERKESDIDLIIVSESFKKQDFRDRSLGFYKYWDLEIPFDFLCYPPDEFNKLKKQITIVREAVKEGIEI